MLASTRKLHHKRAPITLCEHLQMKPLFLPSGDPIADRRADYAEMLFASGDHAAAADLMAQAVECAPEWLGGQYRLGEMHEAAGNREAAADAFRNCLRLDPKDRLGATLRLELLGISIGIEAPPSAFVEALFDQYAEDFDKSLVERLEYRVPELLAEAIASLPREAGAGFAHALDIGCGTGLMGERLRNHVSFLEGMDISGEMLKKAEEKGFYDRLAQSDLNLVERLGVSVDLVVAADVFMYLGALDRVMPLVAGALSPDGVFAFSVEEHTGEEDFFLRPSRRFAHSRPYLERLLAQNGLVLVDCRREVIRMDRAEPVIGLICTARRDVMGDAAALAMPLPDTESAPAL